MKSLRQFDSEKDVETILMNQLHESRILYHKGLIKLSFDQLERTKKQALHSQKFLYYILAARQELQYLTYMQFVGVNESKLLAKQSKIRELLEQEMKIENHSMLYEVLLLRFLKNGIVRSPAEIAQLNDILLEEYQITNKPGEPLFKSEQLHLHFQSIYFRMIGNPKGSLEGFYELDNLFQNNLHLWKHSPIYYFNLLDGILADLRAMEKYEEMPYFLDRLKNIDTSGNMVPMQNCRSFEYELKILIDNNKYEDLKISLSEEKLFDNDLAQLPPQMRAQFNYTLALSYFCIREYSKALSILNHELNQPASLADQSSRINLLLLNLQVNSLMEKTDYVFYALRSVERKLKSERKLYHVEQLIISILKTWLAYKPLDKYKTRLEILSSSPFEHQLIKDLSLHEWISRLSLKKSGSNEKELQIN
ncbi:MAG TPA: hypothetical protein VK921_00315 [Anditalea sp.]|nr:hypothetical protein [Anditalea sp.]